MKNNLMAGTEVKNDAAVFVCQQCGYIYDPAKGDGEGKMHPGSSFEDLPDDWTCPLCRARKSRFSPML